MKEMRSRVKRITHDLNALMEELAVVREQDSKELVEEVLNPEVVKAFKSSVDAMRRVLWLYIEAAARKNSPAKRDLTLQNVADTLRSLRHGAAPAGTPSADRSFIEKVAAIVEKKMPSPHGR